MDIQRILDSSNDKLTATVLGKSVSGLDGAPLGVVAGEVAAKVMVIGAGAGGGAATIADGADVAQGTTTNAPVADNTTVASATAATGIALWKRIVNLLIAILAKTSPTLAVTASGSLVSVSGSVVSGARYVDMLFSSDFDGTVLGVAMLGSAITGYSFPVIGEHTYGAISYTISAGSINILKGV